MIMYLCLCWKPVIVGEYGSHPLVEKVTPEVQGSHEVISGSRNWNEPCYLSLPMLKLLFRQTATDIRLRVLLRERCIDIDR